MASSWRFLPLVAYLRRLQGGHNSPLPEPYRPSWIDGSTLVNKGNQPLLRKLVVELTAGLFALAATACNTVQAVGEDIESVGEAGDRKSAAAGKSVSGPVALRGTRLRQKNQ